MKSIYIHIPFCLSRCHYCNFTSGCDYSQLDSYVQSLKKQIASSGDKNQIISTIFFGGGTPSTLKDQHLVSLLQTINDNFVLDSNCEITIECNPDSLTYEKAELYSKLGINRVSLGLQSCNDSTLKAIGRRHNYKQFCDSVGYLIENGITNINADLMVGLPETSESFIRSVNEVVAMPIRHISMYALEVHEGSVLHKNIASGKLSVASDDEQADLYDNAMKILSQKGFNRYEVSNFSKEGFNCQHNLTYWRAEEYYGFGLSAHGYINGFRYNNTCDMKRYLAGNYIENMQEITAEEDMREYVMLSLRLDCGVSKSYFMGRFGKEIFAEFPQMTDVIEKGYLVECSDKIYVPTAYTYVLSSILTMIL